VAVARNGNRLHYRCFVGYVGVLENPSLTQSATAPQGQ
jgi:hypothetical protein